MSGYKKQFPLNEGKDGYLEISYSRTHKTISAEIGALLLNQNPEILIHGPYCKGKIEVIKITDTKMVIHCKNCGLRLPITTAMPKTIGELRKYLKREFKYSQNK